MDTIELTISQEQAGGNTWACLPFLTNPRDTYIHASKQTYFTGHIGGNLRVSVSEERVKIAGSLSKFYKGTNLYTLNRSDSIRAFEKMADTLHLPIQKATVTRVDIGFNIITDYKPELYYIYFGQSPNYKRYAQPKSIRYENTLRVLKVYDKIAESKKYRVAIPEVFQGKQLMRIELGFKQRLLEQFNIAVITPDILTEENFYINLIDSWYNEYEAIQKLGLPNFMHNMDKISPKDFWKQVNALAVHLIGQELLLNRTEELKAKNSFTNDRSYYRLREEIKEYSGLNFTETPELIQELDKKIARVRQSYR